MNLLFSVVVIGATVLGSTAAPTMDMMDIQTLSNSFSGLIQEDSVPDPGIGKWFTNIYNALALKISRAISLSDRDPRKIDILKQYLKQNRALFEPAANFVERYYPNDIAANNIVSAIRAFFSSLDKIIDGNTAA